MLVIAAGCGSSSTARFVSITNGGVPINHGACQDVTMVREHDDVVVSQETAPACFEGDVIGVGAAGVYWRLQGSELAGPQAADLVEIRSPAPALVARQAKRGLVAQRTTRSLSTGEDRAGLGSGQDVKRLGSGTQVKKLATAENRRGLASGELTRSFDEHAANRRVIDLRKSTNRSTLRPGEQAQYTLAVLNIGVVPITYTVVFDRITPTLEVIQTDARITRLPDDSTFVMWSHAVAIEPGNRVEFRVRVRLRTPTPSASSLAPASPPVPASRTAPVSRPDMPGAALTPPVVQAPPLSAVLPQLRVGQRVRLVRSNGSVVEGSITVVDSTQVVVRGRRHDLLTLVGDITDVTILP